MITATKGEDREATIGRFRDGETLVLTSVNTLGTGFDMPDVGCGIMARPTLSLSLFIQQVGRILRTAPGKDKAILLDHAGNTLCHGLPQDFVVPDLDEGEHKTNKSRKKKANNLVLCADCGAVLEVDQRTCPACGIDQPERASKVHFVDGRLNEFGADQARPDNDDASKRHWYAALKWIAQDKGYKLGWPYHKFHDKFGHYPINDWRRIEPEVPSNKVNRWVKSQAIRWAKSRKRAATS